MRRLVATAVAFLVAGGFYLALIDTVSLPELYAGAGVVLLCVAVFLLSREQGFAEATVSPRWLLRSWRPVTQVPRQIALVSWDAVAQLRSRRHVRGRFRAVPFAGGDTDADRGRRALTEALGSLAPNTIVVGVDAERGLLLVHQLHETGSADDLDALGLG